MNFKKKIVIFLQQQGKICLKDANNSEKDRNYSNFKQIVIKI